MIDYNNGVEDMDMNMKNSMFVYFLISYFVIYKASWLLKGMPIIPGHTKHSAFSVPKYNWYIVAIISYSQTDKMLQAAEEIVGKYIWGQYDLLVMPPSFPYGGMENPCLTFVSPTLLVSYILPCYYDSKWSCCNFKVMNWLFSSITGWWQISCKCKHSSNLHVSFTFSLLSMVTYCGRLCLGAFTFSELSSTHVFTYNGQSMNNAISKLAQLSIPKPVYLSVCPSFIIMLHCYTFE